MPKPLDDTLSSLYDIIATLMAPDGCPWDRIQTLESMKQYLLEETYELLHSIDDGVEAHKTELGDLLFQILFQARLREQEGAFTLTEVIERISSKLISRHPHIFATSAQSRGLICEATWEQQKLQEKARESLMDDIPSTLPALMRADKIQRRAHAVGFDWPDLEGPLDKVHEELEEVKEALGSGDPHKISEEIGDLLFAVTNFARHVNVNSEVALISANEKFRERFKLMERLATERGINLASLDLAEQDRLWVEAKRQIAAEPPTESV